MSDLIQIHGKPYHFAIFCTVIYIIYLKVQKVNMFTVIFRAFPNIYNIPHISFGVAKTKTKKHAVT